jgi:hypothetical protein
MGLSRHLAHYIFRISRFSSLIWSELMQKTDPALLVVISFGSFKTTTSILKSSTSCFLLQFKQWLILSAAIRFLSWRAVVLVTVLTAQSHFGFRFYRFLSCTFLSHCSEHVLLSFLHRSFYDSNSHTQAHELSSPTSKYLVDVNLTQLHRHVISMHSLLN